MELQYYETIRETGHLQVRFEPVLSPAGVFPAHWHEYVEILYIKDGVLSAIVQAVEYELHTGDLMIINSGDLHMTRTPGCHYLILQISARQLRSYLPDFDQLRFDTLIPYTKSKQNAQLFSALLAMETIFQEQPHHYELLFTARLYEFLYILLFSSHFSLPYLHNILYTKNFCFHIYILSLHVYQISLMHSYS